MQTTKIFSRELSLVKDAIGFQFLLSDEIAKLSQLHPNEWASLQKQIANELYNRNLHYLYSSLELAEMGLCDPCYNNIRTIHESILKMYYIFVYPEDIENVHNDMEPNKRPKYGHNFLINHLYSDAMQKTMRKQFGELSVKAHSNYAGVGTTLRYSPEQVKDCLWFLQLMSFYNIIAEVENQALKPSIIEEELSVKISEYLEKMRSNLVDESGNMATYFPDKDGVKEKLRIRPPET